MNPSADDLNNSQNAQLRPDTPSPDDQLLSDSTTSATPSHVSPDTTPASDLASGGPTDSTAHQLAMSDAEQGVMGELDAGVAGQGEKGEDTEPEIGPQPAIKEEGEVSLDHVNGQIEMLDHTQGGYMTDSDGSGVMVDDVQDWTADADHELKRVKVYELVGARWVDQGTAFCFGQFSEESNEALLIARSERNYNEIVLTTTIRSNDVYQRQQDTLIVWTEPDGVDYALSFQDPDGCSEVWQFILEVQRHMNNADALSGVSSSPVLGPDTSVTTASILRSGHLPQPHLGIINEIERAIKALSRTAVMKERICEYIQHEKYIKSLIGVMHTAEELESLENLHALCSLMQTILMLNDHGMYEHIMDDDMFFGVVGILEYDPDFPDHKANYREFLQSQSHFHQPIPIRDPSIQRKVHNAYRLQFLKDVVLARAIDDSTFNVINSCILFNQIDIISHIQHDVHFLRDLISLFVDEAIFFPNKKPPPPQQHQQQQAHLPPNQIIISLNGGSDERDDDMDVDPKSEDAASSSTLTSPPTSRVMVNGSEAYKELRQYYQQHYSFAPRHDLSEEDINLRREVVILLQQLCVMGKNVQLPARLALFRNLVDRGIVFAVQWAISLPDKEEPNKAMISAGGEVLSTLLDHDLNGVRSHVNKHVDAIERERNAKKKFADKAETLLDAMCRIMATTKDLAIQSQIGDALKTWLEVPPGGDSIGGSMQGGDGAGPPKTPAARKEGDTERFLDYFYKNCINVLFKPLMELPEWKNVKGPVLPLYREEANRYTYLADLFHSFIAQHGFRSHLYSISSNVLGRVASLLKAKDKHLRHSAFRIFRYLLKQNNPVSTNMLCKLDVFQPILELTLQESRRDNLLSCSCVELFESMRKDNVKELIRFCMTHHEDLIRKLTETSLGRQPFTLFIQRYEINCQPPPPDSPKSDRIVDPRTWAGPSRGMMEAEEEDYFNGDDDEDDETHTAVLSPNWVRAGPGSSRTPPPSVGGKQQRRRRHARSQQIPSRPPSLPRQPALGTLLDYDDEDEEPLPSNVMPEASSSKITLSPSPEITSPVSSPSQCPVEEEDEEDRLLESLVSRSPTGRATGSPAPTAASSRTSPSPLEQLTQLASVGLSFPLRLGEKRRRDQEDEEEDGLERLRKAKKTTTATTTPTSSSTTTTQNPETKADGNVSSDESASEPSAKSASPVSATTSPNPGSRDDGNNANGDGAKTGDDLPPTRLWRLKVGNWAKGKLGAQQQQKPTITTSSSEPSAKDGDTG